MLVILTLLNKPKNNAEAIVKLADDPELRKKLGNNARKYAEELFDRKNTYIQIENTICCSK